MRAIGFYIPTTIPNVTAAEVVATGANLKDVKRGTVVRLDRFIALSGRTVVLLHNGMTTGNHASWTHGKGMAVDIAFRETEGNFSIVYMVLLAAEAGFTQIGVYWNGVAYSMHLGWGTLGQWQRWRHHREKHWHEGALVVDPQDLEKGHRNG